MKNKICVTAEYFKASKAAGEKDHVMRLFDENKNAYKHLTKNNFGLKDEVIESRYNEAISDIKKLKKNSNTLIDAVFVFPLEQWQKAINDGMKRQDVHDAIWKTMRDIELRTGLQPCGYKMHLDEGYYEDDKFVLNPHAHMMFANICNKDVTLEIEKKITKKDGAGKAMRDPDKPGKWLYDRDETGKIKTKKETINLKNKMPLQYLRGRGSDSVWSDMQDIAADSFAQWGFKRGVSKEITQAEHDKKLQFLAKKVKKLEREVAIQQAENNDLLINKAAIMSSILSYFHRVQAFVTAAIKGDVVALRSQSEAIVRTFENNIMQENKMEAADFLNETLESISDSMKPESDPFAKSLQDAVNKKLAEAEERQNTEPRITQPYREKPTL